MGPLSNAVQYLPSDSFQKLSQHVLQSHQQLGQSCPHQNAQNVRPNADSSWHTPPPDHGQPWDSLLSSATASKEYGAHVRNDFFCGAQFGFHASVSQMTGQVYCANGIDSYVAVNKSMQCVNCTQAHHHVVWSPAPHPPLHAHLLQQKPPPQAGLVTTEMCKACKGGELQHVAQTDS